MQRLLTHGWTPDLPDQRDHVLGLGLINLPSAVDLRPACPPVLDQGELGSCTANAIANAHRFDQMQQQLAVFAPSRLFIYYNEREIEHTIASDAGAQIRDGIKSIAHSGVCDESAWPYHPVKFKTRPPATAYAKARAHTAVKYARVPREHTRSCLAGGYPFVFGFTVYESFESDTVAKSGVVNLPAKDEAVVGGHAVLCVGYDDIARRFLVMNSWGTSWGMSGFFSLPYDYLFNPDLADDLWTVRSVK